jgi:transposase
MAEPLHADDGVWAVLEPLLPERAPQRAGRPRVDDRIAFRAIIFVLVTGVPWRLLPREIGSSSVTAWRRCATGRRPVCGIGCIASCSGGSMPSGGSTGEPGW